MRPNGDTPPPMRAATAGSPGRRGLVPRPPAGSQTKFLRGDGTFQAISGGGDLVAANNLGDVGSFASARANLGVYSQAEVAAQRNALAPAQALSGNGTTTMASGALSAFGANGYTVALTFNLTSLGTQVLFDGSGIFYIVIFADGSFRVSDRISGSHLYTSAAGVVSASTTYDMTVTRGAVYLNGGLVASYADGSTYTGTSYVLGSDYVGGSKVTGTLRLNGIENRTLSVSEVLRVHQTKSFPASDFNSASNTATYTSDFSAGVDLWGVTAGIASATGNVDGVGGLDNWLKYTLGATNALGIYRNTNLVAAAGKRYRYSFTVRHNSATVTSIKVYEYGNPTNAVTGIAVAPNTNVTVTVDLPNPAAAATYLIVQTEQAVANGELLYLRAFTAYNLGLLVAPDPAQLGSGDYWYDVSGNGATITKPASGVDWVNRWSGTLPGNVAVGGTLSVSGTGNNLFKGPLYWDTAASFPGAVSADGQSRMFSSAGGGATLMGKGSTYDVNIANKDGSSVLSVPTGSTSVAIAGTSAIKGVRTATANLASKTIAAANADSWTVTATGAAVGDNVELNRIDAGWLRDGMTWQAYVSAANTVTIRAYNTQASGLTTDPSMPVRVTVTSF